MSTMGKIVGHDPIAHLWSYNSRITRREMFTCIFLYLSGIYTYNFTALTYIFMRKSRDPLLLGCWLYYGLHGSNIRGYPTYYYIIVVLIILSPAPQLIVYINVSICLATLCFCHTKKRKNRWGIWKIHPLLFWIRLYQYTTIRVPSACVSCFCFFNLLTDVLDISSGRW